MNRQVNLTVSSKLICSNDQDFRDLLLWMLDDTSSPEWIEIRHKSYVRACVVLLVPGLSPQTFNIEPTHGSEGKRMRRLTEMNPPSPLPYMTDIFQYLWLPRAPGTNTQIYSPLQAFLNCPLTSTQNLQRAREQSNRKGIKIYGRELIVGKSVELEMLLMNPVEMRNAGYPIHPLHEDGFQDSNIVCTPYNSEASTRRKTVIGMDCEMCLTEQGSEITRVTLVDFQGNPLYDELVKPENPIINYLTTYLSLFYQN